MARTLFVKATIVAAVSLVFFLTGWWLGTQTSKHTESAGTLPDSDRPGVDVNQRVARLEQELSIRRRLFSMPTGTPAM